MPGLFGIVSLDPAQTPLSSGLAQQTLDGILGHLFVDSDYTVETHIDTDRGFAVGRIGHGQSSNCGWPLARAEQAGVGIFSAGVVHAHPPAQGDVLRNASETQVETFLQGFRGFHATLSAGLYEGPILLMADRSSSRPVYFAEIEGFLVFAPEVQGLTRLPGFSRKINHAGMSCLLASGHMFGEDTFFEGVHRLSAGKALRIGGGSAQPVQYWRYEPGVSYAGASEPEMEEELARLIVQSLERNFQVPEKTAVLLSGGVDSRFILAAALQVAGGDGQKINALTWGASENGLEDSDVETAKRIVRACNLKHQFVPRRIETYSQNFSRTNAFNDGMVVTAGFQAHQDTVFREIRERGFHTVFRGDHVFGGGAPLYEFRSAIYECSMREFGDVSLLNKIVLPEKHGTLRDANAEAFHPLMTTYQDLNPNDARSQMYFNYRLQRFLNCSTYARQVYFDERNVLLDDDILDFANTVPSTFRLRKKVFSNALRRFNPELFNLGFSADRPPEDWRQQMSATQGVGQFIRSQFGDRNSAVWDYIDRDALLGVLDRYTGAAVASPGRLKALRSRLEKTASALAPRRAMHFKDDLRKSYLSAEQAVMRVLVLKDWFDRNSI